MGIRNTNRSKQSAEGGHSEGVEDLDNIDAILDRISKELERPRPNGITLQQYCDRTGMSKSAGKERLKRLVDGGIMRVVKWHNGRTTCNVYQFIGEETANGESSDD